MTPNALSATMRSISACVLAGDAPAPRKAKVVATDCALSSAKKVDNSALVVVGATLGGANARMQSNNVA